MNCCRAILLCAVIAGLTETAAAVTHLVPSEFGTIQAAMDIATAGDTVLVAPGIYTDCDGGPCLPAVVVMKTGTTLISEGGPDVTTLRADTIAGSTPVVSSESIGTDGAEINGFLVTASAAGRGGIGGLGSRSLTVRNCRLEDLDNYGLSHVASELTSNSLEVTNCVFLRCVGSSLGAGLRVSSVDVVIEDCLFEDCIGGALKLSGDETQVVTIRNSTFRNTRESAIAVTLFRSVTVEGCWFEGNEAIGPGGLTVLAPPGKSVDVTDCVFLANTSSIWGGAVSTNGGIVLFEGNTVVGNTGGLAGAAVQISSTAATIRNNVIASTFGSGAALGVPLGTTGSCNVFWNNGNGDFANYVADSTDTFEDPRFCDEAGGDFRVASNSPCLSENSNGCGLIGALGRGCGTISVEQTSWGRMKNLYRKGER